MDSPDQIGLEIQLLADVHNICLVAHLRCTCHGGNCEFAALHLWRVYLTIASPSQFAPALLRKRAKELTKASAGQYHYISTFDLGRSKSLTQLLSLSLRRPFGMSKATSESNSISFFSLASLLGDGANRPRLCNIRIYRLCDVIRFLRCVPNRLPTGARVLARRRRTCIPWRRSR